MRNLYIVVLVFISISTSSLFGQGHEITEPSTYENAPISEYPFELGNSVLNVSNTANLFGRYSDGGGMYKIDELGNEINLIYKSYMIMGGYDSDDWLLLTASAEVMKPGPYTTSLDANRDWDRFWEMTSSSVASHIADFSDNGLIDNKQELIYSWPGKGNPHFESYNDFSLLDRNEDLAPFFDNNADGAYNPDDGDYPIIKGDRAVWWMVHSGFGNSFFARSSPVHTEIKGMAYAYNSNDSSVAKTLFLEYKVKNIGEKIFDVRYGQVIDYWTGYNNFSGVDTVRNLLYNYDVPKPNDDPSIQYTVEDTPIVGVIDLSSDDSKSCQSSGFYHRLFVANTWHADIGALFYNIISSRWLDGTRYTQGGSGYNPESNDTVYHLFPDNPVDNFGWSMCTEFLEKEVTYDVKSIMSNGPYDFETDQTLVFNYAIIQADDISYPCPDISGLQSVADGIIAHFNDDITSLKEERNIEFSIYPNPSRGNIHLAIDRDTEVESIKISDLSGKLVHSIDQMESQNNIDISYLDNGVYILSVLSDKGMVKSEMIVLLK